MQAPVLDAFPRRPIALAVSDKDRASRRLWLIGALLLLLPLFYFGYTNWREASLRADLRARGVPAEVLNAEGSCLSRRTIGGDEPRGCDYEISYRLRAEEGGEVRQGSIYVPGSGPRVFAPSARYDPLDPGRIMADADIERDPPIMSLAVPLGLPLLLSGLAFLVWFAMGKRSLAKAASAPRPALVPVRRAAVREKTDVLEVWFERPDGSEGKQGFPGHGPLYVRLPAGEADGRQFALALLGANGRAILLSEDLRELALEEGERAAIVAAARG